MKLLGQEIEVIRGKEALRIFRSIDRSKVFQIDYDKNFIALLKRLAKE